MIFGGERDGGCGGEAVSMYVCVCTSVYVCLCVCVRQRSCLYGGGKNLNVCKALQGSNFVLLPAKV